MADRDVHPGPSCAVFVPLHGESVGGVLGAHADVMGKRPWAELREPDQADAGDAEAVDELRLEWLGELRRHDVRIDAVVDEQPSLDDATHDQIPHDSSSMM